MRNNCRFYQHSINGRCRLDSGGIVCIITFIGLVGIIGGLILWNNAYPTLRGEGYITNKYTEEKYESTRICDMNDCTTHWGYNTYYYLELDDNAKFTVTQNQFDSLEIGTYVRIWSNNTIQIIEPPPV